MAADLLVFIRMLFFLMADFVGVCPYKKGYVVHYDDLRRALETLIFKMLVS